jgi:hypothetical protein
LRAVGFVGAQIPTVDECVRSAAVGVRLVAVYVGRVREVAGVCVKCATKFVAARRDSRTHAPLNCGDGGGLTCNRSGALHHRDPRRYGAIAPAWRPLSWCATFSPVAPKGGGVTGLNQRASPGFAGDEGLTVGGNAASPSMD